MKVEKTEEKEVSLNFIERIIEEHNANGRFGGRVHTRFPPEPNGYLHIGHAKAIYTSFTIAQRYGGKTNLRFDDTNPTTERTDFVNAIQKDIQWLGFQWEGEPKYASDYFQQLYDYAVQLIKQGQAYVDFSTAEDMNTMKKAGENSPYRDKPVEENLAWFEQMKNGELEDGTCVLRLKIDMKSDNWLMRDPVIYRIKKETHHRTGDQWAIYPMYDWAHGISDSLENITHSLCSLEFEVHRPLYDWCLEKLGVYQSQQIEFSRMNVNYTVTSKRKLKELIDLEKVDGWDDPRMPTISGMRRRGYTAVAIKDFIARAGVSRRPQIIDLSNLEASVRNHLNQIAKRVMVVLDPIKVVITNYPEGQTEELTVENNPEDETAGTRQVKFSRNIYIEREDFMIDPPKPKKYYRLAPNKTVRLKGAYIIQCDDYVTDPETGKITELHCSYVPNSKSGEDTSGVKVKGTLHWVNQEDAVEVETRLYDRLFMDENPTGRKESYRDENNKKRKRPIDFKTFLNPNSLKVEKAYAEPYLKGATLEDHFQFMRKGYFVLDQDSTEDKMIFNRTVTLKDGWKRR